MSLQPIWFFIVYLTITPLWLKAQDVLPIPYGHAHNDYQHSRPLEEALEAGFTSIEVDLYYLKGAFYVGHHRPLVRQKKKTLEHLYPKRSGLSRSHSPLYSSTSLQSLTEALASPTFCALLTST